MAQNPDTGEGFDAVQIGEDRYFDPDATDAKYPGAVGLELIKRTFWQGNVEFDTFEVIGPKFGPKWPEGTMKTGGVGMDTDVWGLSDKATPPPGYDPWAAAGVNNGGGTNSGSNILTANPLSTGGKPHTSIVPKHEWTPCFEADGVTRTQGDLEQRHWIDITLLGAYGGDIRFPVMPEEFGADFTHEYWTPKVVGLGEIIMPGGQSMETISWDSFFPSSYDSDYCVITPTELEDPRSITSRLIWTMRFKMDCMLVVGGGIWNDRVVITNFNYRHRAGEIFDIYYTISLKRYRAPVVTTTVNPAALKDIWVHDPRRSGGGVDSGAGTPSETPPGEGNSNEIPVEADPPPGNLDTDFPPGSLPRESLNTIETTTVLGQPAKGIRDPGGPSPAFSETFQQVVARVAKEGPNDMSGMLALNQWVSDNNYNPYTSMLPVGSGVRFYKEKPVSAAQPTTMTSGSLSGAYPYGSVRPPGTAPNVPVWPNLNARPDPSTVVTGGVPTNTPVERPSSGIRR